MVVQSYLSGFLISRTEVLSDYTQSYLDSFKFRNVIDLGRRIQFKFTIRERQKVKKINPVIRKAKVKDAEEIVFMYKEIYKDSYPYKEMENIENVRQMIASENIEWLIFEHPITKESCGCFTLVLDFEDKKGYTRGFIMKKKYEGKMDVIKAFLASFIAMYIKYEGKILRWYGESRTAHSKSQYCMRPGGFRPVAFLPNKDVFYNQVESDILLISYDQNAITKWRTTELPNIVPEVFNCFWYSARNYNLGGCKINKDPLTLNWKKVRTHSNQVKVYRKTDKFGYKDIKIELKGTNSYISFINTPFVQNIEKTEYNTSTREELFVLANEFLKESVRLGVRYLEVYVSAYRPLDQKIFLELGLTPRGYVPSWKLDKKENILKDYIVFNWFSGKIDDNMQILSEGRELLDCLDLD